MSGSPSLVRLDAAQTRREGGGRFIDRCGLRARAERSILGGHSKDERRARICWRRVHERWSAGSKNECDEKSQMNFGAAFSLPKSNRGWNDEPADAVKRLARADCRS